MEVNIFLVVLAVLLRRSLTSPMTSDYQQAVDVALANIQTSSDIAVEVADDAVVKIEDIVNGLNLALAEARFSLIHFANFAANNNLSPLEAMVPVNPYGTCITKDMVSAIKETMTRTGSDMIKCFTVKVNEAEDIYKDTLALDKQAAAIMPKAVARMERCTNETDVVCLEIEMKEILDGSARIENELVQNVVRAEELVDSLNSHLEQCLGHMVVVFIANVGKFGSDMVSCFVKAV